jgi:hypothetical protein
MAVRVCVRSAPIVLVGGDKAGENQTMFHNRRIKIADARFSVHLRKVKPALKKEK